MTPLALGRLPEVEFKSKAEADYAMHLEAEKQRGAILWYKYEQYTFKLAHDLRYTPDFVVMAADHYLDVHEVKGFMREDAYGKIKTLAAMFPHRVFVVKRNGQGGWDIKKVPCG